MSNKTKESMDFWGRVEDAMKEKSITSFSELSQRIGASKQTLANKRCTAKLPNIYTTLAIAKELGKPAEWLVYGIRTDTEDKDINEILSNKQLYSISQSLTKASPNELFAIEVVLKLRQ
ncbi:MAG: hypothetical protein PHT39_02345 [Sphaerochaetaceae bacterium]|nr:hypothetical protein [Sphaerochaetaceae bacterium]